MGEGQGGLQEMCQVSGVRCQVSSITLERGEGAPLQGVEGEGGQGEGEPGVVEGGGGDTPPHPPYWLLTWCNGSLVLWFPGGLVECL